LKNVDVGDWHGQTADAYQGQAELQRARLVMACDVYRRVADAVAAHYWVLAWARGEVGEELARWRAGGVCTVGQPGMSDEQAAAVLMLGETLQQVDASEQATVDVLDEANRVGPAMPLMSIVTGESDDPWQQDGVELGAGLMQAVLIFASDGEAAGGIKSGEFAVLSAAQVERFTALADRADLRTWRPMFKGTAFNWEQYASYDAMEVRLLDLRGAGTSTYRLDSYTPGELVVSRKCTQLAQVDPASAIAYLREMTVKYNPGEAGLVVDRTPMNQLQLDGTNTIGLPLKGRMVLEVPVQGAPVPPDVLRYAAEKDIMIVDPAGTIYRLPKGAP
jgi:hypothetical protein